MSLDLTEILEREGYELVCGLEVHTQLNTRTKAFSAAPVDVWAEDNTSVNEVCAGHPGTLPVFNAAVLEKAIMLALATDCEINELSYFDRKNYFYPDLPKGYQITQYHTPLAQNGFIEILLGENLSEQACDKIVKKISKKIGIERIQIEEDTAKSTHSKSGSLINLNRAGTPLLEVVGRPDIREPKEASLYLKKLHAILVYLGVSRGNLQEGNFRCDVNVSLRKRGAEKLGTRTETKNLNSFRNVEKAIELEALRQLTLLKAGRPIEQATLTFDPEKEELRLLRIKSDEHDYRYFPEPDLLPLHAGKVLIARLRNILPELPEARMKRFVESFAISSYDAQVLTSDRALGEYFEEASIHYLAKSKEKSAKKVANWIMVELLRYLKESALDVENSPVSPTELAELIILIEEGAISGKQAKEVFLKMFDEKISAKGAVKELSLKVLDDLAVIEKIASELLDTNPAQIEQYFAGKDRVLGFFVGQIMKSTKGQANPQKASDVVRKLLEQRKP